MRSVGSYRVFFRQYLRLVIQRRFNIVAYNLRDNTVATVRSVQGIKHLENFRTFYVDIKTFEKKLFVAVEFF